jgi:hypothetical protein
MLICTPVRDLGPGISPNAPDPRVLTWSQFCLCIGIANQRVFIWALISVFCKADRLFVVGFKPALPAEDSVTQIGALQDLLLREDIIRKIGYLCLEGGSWVHLAQFNRRTLQYSRFSCLETQFWF